MKRKHVTLAVLLAALSFVASPSVNAISHSDTVAIKKAVASVPAAELAARAAQMVSKAGKSDRKDVALTFVRETVSARPSTVVAVVAAIAKAAPDLSSSVAAEAAKLTTQQAAEIAKAAAASAPAQAEQIAAAVSKAVPDSATKVTRAVASTLPEQAARIVETVSTAVPQAKPALTTDASLVRLTQRSSSETVISGTVESRPGTIRGGPTPNITDNFNNVAVEGVDPARKYAQP